MLTTYRRHLKTCEHRKDGRKYRRCRCPIWVDGFLGGQEIRKSLGMRDWEKAQDRIREWEAAGELPVGKDGEPMTIEEAKKQFLADAEARKLKNKTVYKYRLLFRHLAEFAKLHGIRFLKELDTPTLRKFRASWKDNNLAALKKLERLRSFFRFARENGWVETNPAGEIKNPKVTMRPTLPFSRDEMFAILKQAAKNIDQVQSHGRENACRLRVLLLLLRYTGLRIGDAVSCSIDRPIEQRKDSALYAEDWNARALPAA